MAVFPLGIFMNKFMNENFLLKSELAQKLFQKSSKMPIIDYHCHLSPKEIYEDKTFDNITQIWLYGDHYKWRLMRAAGIDEEYITGKASDLDKFKAYAKLWNYVLAIQYILSRTLNCRDSLISMNHYQLKMQKTSMNDATQ